MKLTRLPDGEREESRYQSEDGRFTIEGPAWKKNSGYGKDWTLTDSKRFMIDRRPRFGYAAVVTAVHERPSLAECRERIERILAGEADGRAGGDSWYGYSTREAAQAAIDAYRAGERESRRFWDGIKRREARCKAAAAANPAIREAAAQKAAALDQKVKDARKALWRAEEAQRRLKVVAGAE
ncbi:MAG: hypothetical protein EPO16_04735 [Dehalococcoidia bacterium]|nr:MAG: hypothetical protein EPO16_04735 [Dehalococcoidia bacterium]